MVLGLEFVLAGGFLGSLRLKFIFSLGGARGVLNASYIQVFSMILNDVVFGFLVWDSHTYLLDSSMVTCCPVTSSG